MKKTHTQSHLFSKETWVFLLLTVLSVIAIFKYVDLTPHVDNDFFFSLEDPNYQADAQITRLFERKDSQLIIMAKGNIFSREYQDKVRNLTEIISNYESIGSVFSITQGPRSIQDAIHSPLWRRALIAEDQASSNIIAILDEDASSLLIPKIQDLASAMNSDDFKIKISGFPYIVEMIRKNLRVDLNVFSTLAVILFSIVVLLIFHSWRILMGMIVTCVNAGAITFMLNHLFHFKIGILTANLATIVFVLALSHIVFLTFNWKHLHHRNSLHNRFSIVQEAVHITFSASFWSMFTTLLGFISLLFVQAKPLRELGIGGAIATIVAFTVVYSIYPSFLSLKEFHRDWEEKQLDSMYHKTFRLFDKNYATLVIAVMAILVATAPKLWSLNTDPSLLAYFSKKSELYKGLKEIDKSGGSSPLVIVVKDPEGQTLNTNRIYRRLWRLQEALEKQPDIGTILSLPALIKEGKRAPLSFLASSESLLRRLEQDRYDRIATSFVTPDRQYGLFLIRMNEEGRKLSRLEVVKQIKEIVQSYGFVPHLVGGIYALQGHLAAHIAKSLIYGLSRLGLAFIIIALIVSLSLRIALAMSLSISFVALCVLGGLGYFKIPLDTISAPATNIAIAMGIDAMIHMVHAYRRLEKQGHHRFDDWVRVRRKLWEPIITSMLIICTGFGIFFFSNFPPTQRFGGAIVFGTIISAVCALFIFPLLAKKSR